PAPAGPLPNDLLRMVDILTPNESEAALLTTRSASQVEALLALLSSRGSLIITRGQLGAELVRHSGGIMLPAYAVTAVDTTGAGDAFNGALATALARGTEILEAVRYANAAALSITRFGAQTSLPTHDEVIQFMRVSETIHSA
ncbi:MAG TPA: PfkB family carbohydrate kinase, partial [Thermoguttaceae bacterium]